MVGIFKKNRRSKSTKSQATSAFKINWVLKEKYENENKKKKNSQSEQSNKKRKRTILYDDESGGKKIRFDDKKNLEALEKSNQETMEICRNMEVLKEKVKTLEKSNEETKQDMEDLKEKVENFRKSFRKIQSEK